MAQVMDDAVAGVCENDWYILPAALERDRVQPEASDFIPLPAVTEAQRTRKRWSKRLEQAFEASWITLMLACAAECVYRLWWAVQP